MHHISMASIGLGNLTLKRENKDPCIISAAQSTARSLTASISSSSSSIVDTVTVLYLPASLVCRVIITCSRHDAGGSNRNQKKQLWSDKTTIYVKLMNLSASQWLVKQFWFFCSDGFLSTLHKCFVKNESHLTFSARVSVEQHQTTPVPGK